MTTLQLGTGGSQLINKGTSGLEAPRTVPKVTGGYVIGDGPQGTLTSPPFVIISSGSINFLIGGGCSIDVVRAELIVNDQVRAHYLHLTQQLQNFSR